MKDVEEAAYIHDTVHTAAEAMVKQLALGCDFNLNSASKTMIVSIVLLRVCHRDAQHGRTPA